MLCSEGKKAQDIARLRLEEAGFLVDDKAKVKLGGIQFNFMVTSARTARSSGIVDVSGAFTTSRPGLLRTDSLWKLLGRLHVLRSVPTEISDVLVLTSNLPRPGSEGHKALQAVGPAGCSTPSSSTTPPVSNGCMPTPRGPPNPSPASGPRPRSPASTTDHGRRRLRGRAIRSSRCLSRRRCRDAGQGARARAGGPHRCSPARQRQGVVDAATLCSTNDGPTLWSSG